MNGAEEPVAEMAPDINAWPGTSEAAKQAGRHPSTIKLWRTQGRIRAIQDGAGCWRYHPDDLAESVDTPDSTDPGAVLASGMSAIVQQGANANERLLAMTEIATTGLQNATGVLSNELERAYARIAELEEKLAALRDKHALTHAEDLRHERYLRRLDQKHELGIESAREASQRIGGLLAVLGPIAASISLRLAGQEAKAEAVERAAAGGAASPPGNAPAAPSPAPSPIAPPAAPPPATPLTSSLVSLESLADVPIETRITDAMGRLCIAIRMLDRPAFAGLRAMLPPNVAEALDAIVKADSDGTVGHALAVIVRAAQGLSDLQFMALRPIAPADVASVLAELRALLRQDDDRSAENVRS